MVQECFPITLTVAGSPFVFGQEQFRSVHERFKARNGNQWHTRLIKIFEFVELRVIQHGHFAATTVAVMHVQAIRLH